MGASKWNIIRIYVILSIPGLLDGLKNRVLMS